MSRRVVPVSRLVRYIKESFEGDPVLHGVLIEGEISNLRIPNSGHWYFSLKDDKASITCVMFAYQNRKVNFRPKNGDKVILCGDISVYESMGSMQMIASTMQPSGIGELYLQFEMLKKKLLAEGLFDAEHKKPLPAYPMHIALITGSNTAAREDVLITFHKRWPIAEITEYPAPVQGNEAVGKIIQALMEADQGGFDVILLARGGGSLEDLWCFNNEELARCIYNMKTPIVTGIGHETDTTLVDYVSDVRANTPTGAVEVATPDIFDVQADLNTMYLRMINAMKVRKEKERRELKRIAEHSVFKNPKRILQEKTVKVQFLYEKLSYAKTHLNEQKQAYNQILSSFNQCLYTTSKSIRSQLNSKQSSLHISMKRRLDTDRHVLESRKERMQTAIQTNDVRFQNQTHRMIQLLDAYSPLKVLSRGYSVTYHNQKVLTHVQEVSTGDQIQVRLADGTLEAKVEDIKNG